MRIVHSFVVACSLAAGLLFGGLLSAQAPSQGATRDYSKEPFVVELLQNDAQFERDGTSAIETRVRVRIQSASGVQGWGLIQLPYASSTGVADIMDVRVTRPDGTVVTTPPEGMQDMPAQITVAAPFYSDLKIKQLAVKGLDVGDVLEYRETFHLRSPLIPNQFWFDHDFSTDVIVLDEELQIRVPRDRDVKLKSPKLQPASSEENGYRVYSWKTANLQTKADRDKDEKGKGLAASDKPFADVQLTSFRDWDEIGQWYRQLQDPRVVPTPEIRAKAEDLTRGATSDDAKIRALYGYVSTKFRYIGVAFGIGRYQPHAAADVLDDGYGDCKDKHTLLAALLASVGIKAYPALINSSATIDPDVPSPNQFDHVITVVPQGKDVLWFDTTPEVAPFGMLMASLRDKQALVIGTGPAQLLKTPADPPFKQSMVFHIEGKIGSNGTLDGKVDASARGDVEVLLRNAFHQSSPAQWNDVLQNISQAWNFGGTVSDGTVSPAEAIENPFTLKYTYTRKDYPNWPDVLRPPLPPSIWSSYPPARTTVPSPSVLDRRKNVVDAEISLPPNLAPKAHAAVDITKDFAEYHAAYSFDSNVVYARRRLTVLMREIPRARSGEYRAFWKEVSDDQDALIVLTSASPAATSNAAAPAEASPDARAETLIDLGDNLLSQDVDAAIADFRQALQLRPDNPRGHHDLADALFNKDNFQAAAAEYREALRLRPDYPEAHRGLGESLFERNDLDGAIAEYHETLRLKPDDARANESLGDALSAKNDFEGAIAAFREALRLQPDYPEAHRGLGEVFSKMNDFDAAIPEYREALRLNLNDSRAHSMLGNALYQKKDLDGAVSEYREATRLAPDDPYPHLYMGEALRSKQDLDGAMAEYREALRLKPDFAEAHLGVGAVLSRRGMPDQAIEELKKAVSLNPQSAQGYQLLATAYGSQHRDQEALESWRQFEKFSPGSALAAGSIATLLIQQKRYAEAIAELQPAIQKNPRVAGLDFELGKASIRSGDVENGMAALRKALDIDSAPTALNSVSYELAEDNVHLDDALRFAEQAVEQQQKNAAGMSLQTLTVTDLRIMPSLAAEWDTLGWVQFRLGNIDEAEKYLAAAWELAQRPDIGDHLGQLYEKRGDNPKAIHLYEMTLAAGGAEDHARDRLVAFLGSKAKADEATTAALEDLMQLRTAKLPRLTRGDSEAEFFVEFVPSLGATNAKFISGSEDLRDATKAVLSADFGYTFPNNLPVKIVRRSILACPATGPDCQMILLPVESVTKVN